jgi:glycosyltransferase involved in cell wall biosynthesis
VTVPQHQGLVSIVVASYNHADFLTRRMDSLIGQTYPDVDILVIDDKSPDHSVEILRHYEANSRVRLVLRDQNGGWVTVSNQGVDLSSGEYVLFANCDDDCDPRMVERLVDALQQHPSAGIAFCRSLMVDEDDQVLGDDFTIREASFRKRCAQDTLLSGSEASRFLLHSCVIPNLSAALFRRECFNQVGKFSSSYRVCSDWDLFFRVASQYDIAYVAEPLNLFRQHRATIRSVTKDRVLYEEYFRLLLGEILRLDLSSRQRMRYRTRVMYLWAAHLLSPSWVGLTNLPYHLGRIWALDPVALTYFLPACFVRVSEIAAKAAYKLYFGLARRVLS